MEILIVVDNPKDWVLETPGVRVISARSYLTQTEYGKVRAARVFNLCRSYRYQSLGYYVSLLAAARGHKPLPTIATVQDLKSQLLVRYASDELHDLSNKCFATIHGTEFVLSIYFGRNLARRYDRISSQLFRLFPAPLLRAIFRRDADDDWTLQSVRPIPASEIPADHHAFVVESAVDYFSRRSPARIQQKTAMYDLAILWDPEEREPPSDEKALQRFTRAAEKIGFGVERITREDYGRLAEFDALWIRETTNVNHHTFRFARRAEAEGLAVIDDPDSILLCTNKVFLAELLARHGIPTPRTVIVHRDNVAEVAEKIGIPCILKAPDSAFSQGVHKVEDAALLERGCRRLLEKSDLILAQEFMPTPFDWRIGILDRKAHYACRYYMSQDHWQIMEHRGDGDTRYGDYDVIALEECPPQVVETALKAANLIGDGLYGVDLKEVDGKVFVIEVNDNPSIEGDVEDQVLKEELYRRLAESFLRRIEARRMKSAPQ